MELREIPIEQIKIANDRFREDFGDIESLAESIKRIGQLVPILVTDDYKLIAGERRIRACKLANIPTIKALIVTADEIKSKVYEITENIERKDFTWQEKAKAMKELHQMLSRLYPDWSARKTSDEIGLAISTVTTDLNLADAIDEAPELFKDCKTKKDALKVLQKYKIDEAVTELMTRKSQRSLLAKASEILFRGDCVELCDTLPAKSIDAVITDPPYGIDIDKTKKLDVRIGIYEDKAGLYKNTMEALIRKLDRVLKDDSVAVIFCASEWAQFVKDLLRSIGFLVPESIAYWVKPIGQTNQPHKCLASCCEYIVYGLRGNATIQKQGRTNVFQYQSVTPSNKIHPVQKPLNLMEDILETFTLPGFTVLDPFAGAATTLIAALKRGCFPIGFELDEHYYAAALDRLSRAIAYKDGGMADRIVEGSV